MKQRPLLAEPVSGPVSRIPTPWRVLPDLLNSYLIFMRAVLIFLACPTQARA